MFNVGPFELIVILVVLLVVVGPEQLPLVVRRGSQLVAQARRYSNDLRNEFEAAGRRIDAEVNALDSAIGSEVDSKAIELESGSDNDENSPGDSV